MIILRTMGCLRPASVPQSGLPRFECVGGGELPCQDGPLACTPGPRPRPGRRFNNPFFSGGKSLLHAGEQEGGGGEEGGGVGVVVVACLLGGWREGNLRPIIILERCLFSITRTHKSDDYNADVPFQQH